MTQKHSNWRPINVDCSIDSDQYALTRGIVYKNVMKFQNYLSRRVRNFFLGLLVWQAFNWNWSCLVFSPFSEISICHFNNSSIHTQRSSQNTLSALGHTRCYKIDQKQAFNLYHEFSPAWEIFPVQACSMLPLHVPLHFFIISCGLIINATSITVILLKTPRSSRVQLLSHFFKDIITIRNIL